jgi:hypothetical protein
VTFNGINGKKGEVLFFCSVLDITVDKIRSKNIHTYYIHTYHSRFSPEGEAGELRYCSEAPMFYQNYLAVRNAINPLVAFYNIHGKERELFYVGHHKTKPPTKPQFY